MSKKIVFAIVGLVGIVGLFVFIFTTSLNQKNAAIKLTSRPSSTVYINGKEAGSSPYENNELTAGMTKVKLVLADSDQTWQRDLQLTPNTQTIVDWSFGDQPDQSSGAVLYLEKTSFPKRADLVVTCQPSSCSVKVDGQLKGPAPLNLEDVTEGEHTVTVSQPGYATKEFSARAVKNYRLVIEMQLAKEQGQESNQPNPTPTSAIAEPKVIILDTPTGWLRVRAGPSTGQKEVAKVDPDEKFVLLDEQDDWYQIEYEQDKKGWISGQYAEKLDTETTPVPAD